MFHLPANSFQHKKLYNFSEKLLKRWAIKLFAILENRLRVFKIRLRELSCQIVSPPDSSSSFWKSCTTFSRRNYLAHYAQDDAKAI